MLTKEDLERIEQTVGHGCTAHVYPGSRAGHLDVRLVAKHPQTGEEVCAGFSIMMANAFRGEVPDVIAEGARFAGEEFRRLSARRVPS